MGIRAEKGCNTDDRETKPMIPIECERHCFIQPNKPEAVKGEKCSVKLYVNPLCINRVVCKL